MLMVMVMEMIRRWKWVRTSDLWAATSARGRSSWAEGLSWDLARSASFFFFQAFLLRKHLKHLPRSVCH